MREIGCNVGGEQSGHMILSDFGTTGDGLVAALQVLARWSRKAAPRSEVCRLFDPLPQLLKNVRFAGASPLKTTACRRRSRRRRARLGGAAVC